MGTISLHAVGNLGATQLHANVKKIASPVIKCMPRNPKPGKMNCTSGKKNRTPHNPTPGKTFVHPFIFMTDENTQKF